ncbi:MAG: DNA translocase FtsK 4TM domain-containing protein [Deltaproteobacteria bacterium]|nr:DNA translocase FtsK 4TM domain-containing protein [Deltaproteobacteria bacterium]MBW2360230.1 DNA translocase FtsK 4TM domain-containing protein [Deltaproteobacteria bacterium]
MARASAKQRGSKGRSNAGARSRVVQECVGVALIGLALLLGLALGSFDPADPAFEALPVANRAGVFGASSAALLFGTLGLGSLVCVVGMGYLGLRLVIARGVPSPRSRFWVGAVLLLVATATFPPLIEEASPGAAGAIPAGWLGRHLAGAEGFFVGAWGALLLNSVVGVIGLLSWTGVSTGTAFGALGVGVGWIGAALAAVLGWMLEWLRGLGARCAHGIRELWGGLQRGFAWLGVWREQRRRRMRVAAARADDEEEDEDPSLALEELSAAPLRAATVAPAATPKLRRSKGDDPMIVDHAADRARERSQTQEAFHFEDGGERGPYELPDITRFQKPPERTHQYDRESLVMNSRILEKKLSDFGVGGRVITVHPGPVITMYEFEPASGIKVNKIVGLSDDLALALRALSVRIIAPLPGKSVVGVEVANQQRETVYIRDLVESEPFRDTKARLNIALGKDIFGNATFTDLARMPHLLVAGATGTGKSVFLNSLLCSILCRATPDDLKLLLIDPKLLELSIYEGIPHLLADVVTNPKRASAALMGVVHKMEERYRMMQALGVRSIDQYNTRVKKEMDAGNTTFRLRAKPGEEEGEEVAYRRFPYIVVVIDELADLMVVSARDVEESLQRLAQMARAAGIHLVLATQRPSVDVLTGVIKANFPARISFQVSSRTDSRTILDQNGADQLLGMGDMLFLPPGTSKLQRVHGAFVTEDEVADLVRQLREQGAPQFDETLIRVREESESKEAGTADDTDEMYDRAVAIVAETRNASISYVQRRLKVGYNRAARMVEQMEEEGVIGPQVGTKPREVFVSSPEA